jgi:phosphoglycerol transferase MdoB-like AlkP superfamily enzyme
MIVPVNIAGSPAYALAKSFLIPAEARGINKILNDQSIINKFNIIDWSYKNKNRSIFFVIIESYGIVKSKTIHDWVNNHVSTSIFLPAFYQISFKGATTSGELRSLCGLEGTYKSVNITIVDDCLPAQLLKRGWKTIGFHGFSMKMFNREKWWPLIGLNQSYFAESKELHILPKCGNMFRGVCDKDLIRFALKKIKEPKSFGYLLTLNTHLPVIQTRIPLTLSKICEREHIPNDACMHIAAQTEVLVNIISEASVMPQPPLVIIVGDHAPPFVGLTARNTFRQDVVPGYVFVPLK